MSRRLLSTAAALMLAGGVYLTAGTAEASNMGFKLERSFSFVTGAKNLYYVSFPLFNGLGDISNGTDSCSTGDGVVDASDALCDLTTDRDMITNGPLMTIQRIDESTCLFQGRSIIKGPAGISFIGDFTTELTSAVNREIGFIINVPKVIPSDPDVENRAVIVGSHDPSWAGKTVSRACPLTVLNVPYHTMYRSANEVLCGLEGVDWVDEVDTNGNPTPDGAPDTCDAGVFDPMSGVSVTVNTFDNATGRFDGRSAFRDPLGNLRFIGPNFDLTPGDAYPFNMNSGYADRLWRPPHF